MAKYLRKRKRNPLKIMLTFFIITTIIATSAFCVWKFNRASDDPMNLQNNNSFHSENSVVIEDSNFVNDETIISSSPEITLSYEYKQQSENHMAYGLITPSSADRNNKTPLIVSLHRRQEIGCSDTDFEYNPIVKTMRNWSLEGFNAYVLFPHLTGGFKDSSWDNNKTANNVINLINYIIEEYNIDESRIIIQGSDIGSLGAFYIADYKEDFFSSVVAISPENSKAKLTELMHGTPVRCYVGSQDYGEKVDSVKYAFGRVAGVFGIDSVMQRHVSHEEIPVIAFREDLNEDGKSDLIEWILSQSR